MSVNPDDKSYGLQRGFDTAALSYAIRSLAELGQLAADAAVPRLLDLATQRERAFDWFFAAMAVGHLNEARDAPRAARPWLRAGGGLVPIRRHAAACHGGGKSSRSGDDPAGDIAAGIAKLQAAHSQIDTMGFRTQLAFCLASLAEGYLLNRDLAAAQSAGTGDRG